MTPLDDDALEDETCRRFVLPALKEKAEWPDHRIRRQYQISDGKIRATARLYQRDKPLRADYVLEHADGLPIGVVEAKRANKKAEDGLEQAKRYARLLDVPFAYATNGQKIVEFDASTGALNDLDVFPTPEELWRRYRTAKGLADGPQTDLVAAPFDTTLRNWDRTPKQPRYYQRVAINRALQAIARGDQRLLLVLATGTGKTLVAAQIVAKLWKTNWPENRKPRVLYLADRNILVDQPKDDYFTPIFGDAVHKLGKGEAKTGRNIYFGLYQSLDSGEEESSLYRQYRPDYFDLVIVDECHRGSAREASQWRQILEYFSSATQVGLTATPVGEQDADTYGYFGDPIYEYSLRQGIEDGFLAPYRVRKVRLNVDMTGWRPDPGQKDIFGNEIPDKLYGPREYERVMAILERTDEAAHYLTEYLHRTGRMGKTIVFCENTDHADRMRKALNNANKDLVKQYSNYVCTITSRDGTPGKVLLDEFRQVDTDQPVIAVTSKLLSTGVDIPTVRNIVLFRRIGSMPEFKQIIGRGTRLFPEADKLTFDIIDFVDATRLFNDPQFDGPPLRVVRDETDETGHIVDTVTEDLPEQEEDADEVAEPPGDYAEQDEGTFAADDVIDQDEVDRIQARSERFYVRGVDVFRWGSALYVSASDGHRLQLVELRKYVKDRVIELNLEPAELRAQWARAKTRRALQDRLEGTGIEFDDLAEELGQPEADPIDLLLYVTWELPTIPREERARRISRYHRDFLDSFTPAAQEILNVMLEQYAEHGADELTPAALRTPSFERLGTVTELAQHFGGGDELREALDRLGELLYDAS